MVDVEKALHEMPFLLGGTAEEMGQQLRNQLAEHWHQWEECQRRKGIQSFIAKFRHGTTHCVVEWRYRGCREVEVDDQGWGQPVHEVEVHVTWSVKKADPRKELTDRDFHVGWVVGRLEEQGILDALAEQYLDNPDLPVWVVKRFAQGDSMVVRRPRRRSRSSW